MNYSRKSVLLALLCFFSGTPAFSASTLNGQMEKIARKFSGASAAMGLSTATVAVFPFEADERLSRKKVNFAVSELLTHHILKLKTLQITERAQLSEVLKEQKLGLSGAIDTRTAAAVGQVLGARLLALGNVVKLGDYYQVTAKLVDAKTAELAASEIIEVPIDAFEKDAAPYLALVPQKQAIGIFLAGNYSALTTHNSGPSGDGTFIPANPDATIASPGGGLRYWPAGNWMIEASYFAFRLNGGQAYTTPCTPISAKPPPSVSLEGDEIRLSANRIYAISNKFRLHLGAGALYINAKMPNSTSKNIVYYNGSSMLIVLYAPKPLNYLTPLLRAGLEWKPQERFGWGIFANCNLLPKTVIQRAVLEDGTGSGTAGNIRVWKAALSPFSLQTTLSLYF